MTPHRFPDTRCVRAVLATLIVLLVVCAVPARAQSECELKLSQAEESYLAGRIDEVFDLLEPCLRGRVAKRQQAAAFALAAKAHLGNDDLARAVDSVRALIALDSDFTPDFRDPLPFAEMVEEVKRESAVTRVASVSKTDEPLAEAPATVVVVTAAEIERRGYLDLEQVLHDLPGFDVSRGNGDVYSNFYQGGFRSSGNERTLLLVDGIEQNELMSNIAYLSRQFPLSNVDRIEVIYGPASTMYGANAYTGVISILTRSPDSLIADDKAFGFSGQVVGGSLGTRVVDLTLAGRTRRLSWSLTGRVHGSSEPDLARFGEWDYDPGSLDDLDYDQVFGLRGSDANLFNAIFGGLCPPGGDGGAAVCRTVLDDSGAVVAVEVTEEGRRRATQVDGDLLSSSGFADETEAWSLIGKLQFGSLTVGLQGWELHEGTAPWYTDRSRDGRDSNWAPRQLAVYVHYTRDLSDRWLLAFSSRYKRHDLRSDSVFATYSLLANGQSGNFLNLLNLVFSGGPFAANAENKTRTRLEQASTQFRNELTLVYKPSSKLNVVTGVEVRNSSIQADFRSTDPDTIEFSGNPADRFKPIPTGPKIEQVDLGAFAQASFWLRPDLKAVAGARIDHNEIENAGPSTVFFLIDGFGTVFNPRLALVYTPRAFVFKVIYAEAFKDPSALERYSSVADVRVPSFGLEQERVENLELSGRWQPHERLELEVAAYQSDYSTVVGTTLRRVDQGPAFPPMNPLREQFNNLGALRIRGVQATASWRLGDFGLSGNYTYTDPRNTEPLDELGNPLAGVDELRIADIAAHQLNLGVDARFRDRLDVNLRVNWVDRRRTGAGTTAPANPSSGIDAYLVTHGAVRYRDLLPGLDAQLIFNNLLDADYEHPGVRAADGVGFAARLPQAERAVFLRFLYKM